MSLKNRKKQYDKLKANTLAGRIPGIDQDDGALVREFGAVIIPTPKKEVVPDVEPVFTKPLKHKK